MTLRQFVTLTEAYDRVDVRRAMVVALARERPRNVEAYRRFYWAVSLCLPINSARACVSFGLHTDCTAWRPLTSELVPAGREDSRFPNIQSACLDLKNRS